MCVVCRDPLPLSISHIPISISFAFFDNGNFMLVDPTQREQLVADGMVIVAMNKHREVCMIETLGCVLLVLEQVSVSSAPHSFMSHPVRQRYASMLIINNILMKLMLQSTGVPTAIQSRGPCPLCLLYTSDAADE